MGNSATTVVDVFEIGASLGLERKGIKLRVGMLEGKGREGMPPKNRQNGMGDGNTGDERRGEGLLLRIYKINSLVRGSPSLAS